MITSNVAERSTSPKRSHNDNGTHVSLLRIYSNKNTGIQPVLDVVVQFSNT